MTFEHFQTLVDMMFEEDGEGGVRQRYGDIDAKTLHPLILAYLGDAYFHLFVRGRLLSYEQSKVRALNEFSAQIVSAVWQARAYRNVEEILSEEEKAVYRRGRNAKSHAPRKATVAEYHSSTGLEALMGFLYLKGEHIRLHEIAEAAFQAIAREIMTERKKKRR